ncbi:MAG: single-stranded-DNA-specific exonuclease RecJ [Candidatus Sumerlaeaceae bacterium]|nr:single-stranded-DNA-specific exonuclease RecJ [Candidatus Sumerlaeaceae bacterium]
MTAARRTRYHKIVERPFRWIFRQRDPVLAERLSREKGFHPVVARILAARAREFFADGDDFGEYLARFLSPKLGMLHDPMLLADMEAAVDRVRHAVKKNEKIVVYGDYDSDGTTATALLMLLFQFLRYNEVQYYIPHRLEEGYGLNEKALRNLAADGVSCILTVDNGITALEEAESARRLGLDLVITDHHRPGSELPTACAVVNPNRQDCPYPFKYLSGVGVAFKFAHALLKKCSDIKIEDARKFLESVLDLVAIGTVADIVPLVGENRILVAKALPRMRKPRTVRMKAMTQVWDLPEDTFGTHTISFRVAPRLNAAGRTDHAGICVELLTTNDFNRACRIAADLEAFNAERRDLESWILRECLSFIDHQINLEEEPIIVVDGEDWHIGVLGIVASRITDYYSRPAIVISRRSELSHGSGRSPEAFNLHQALSATSQYLLEWGGHAHAAGLRLKTSSIHKFREAINTYARSFLEPETLVPQLTLDTEIAPEEFQVTLIDELSRFEPYGEGNPPPVLAMRELRLVEPPRVVGTNHLKLRFGAGRYIYDAIGFQLGELCETLRQQRHNLFDVAFSPTADTFSGSKKITMEIKDLRVIGG